MRTDARLWPALLALLAGCATVDARPSFDEVRGMVALRAPDADLAWSGGGTDDAVVKQRVRTWLEDPLTAATAVRIALLNNRNLRALYGELGVAQADLVVELATRVKRAFVRLQGNLQRLELDRTVVEATALAADVSRRQHTAGTITDLDLANEEALSAQARVDLARDEARVAEDREALSALMGLWGADSGWRAEARLPEVPAEPLPASGLESLAVAQRLDLAAARAATKVVAEKLALERFYGLLREGDLGLAVGSTRDIEFVADAPGDWAMHCHMTHHVMNQMGHDIPNMLGLRRGDLDEKMRALLPDYMTMGQDGMGEMGDMGMRVPKNSIPMRGGKGPHGYIDMGGMFTVLKVREQLDSYADPGWYRQPPDTAVRRATAAQLRADGIRTS
jgi:hypothetical protein